MKIWKSFSAEHSAKLRIVGTFKNADDAKAAESLFNDLLKVDEKELQSKSLLNGELSRILQSNNFMSFNEHDPEQMMYFSPVEAVDNKIVINTDELEIQAVLKILLHKGAAIKIHSKHDYPEYQ